LLFFHPDYDGAAYILCEETEATLTGLAYCICPKHVYGTQVYTHSYTSFLMRELYNMTELHNRARASLIPTVRLIAACGIVAIP
jgi:hypothetical protein